ncbi:FDLD family class I lanthipeptide [Tumebacillus sp. ITR2]|uniref:FDLD family class I lanthipeptide n=1 Tax=Tumebacillus amylolyticus TaxID=2801339 RepID=A0ABS1JEG6_9BACL|nr:FDLD family class I lanthipeptide [Tumebacillus amylolyticus]
MEKLFDLDVQVMYCSDLEDTDSLNLVADTGSCFCTYMCP